MPWTQEQRDAQRQRMLEHYATHEHYMTGRTQSAEWVENARRARWGGERKSDQPTQPTADQIAQNAMPLAECDKTELQGIAITKGIKLPKRATKVRMLELLAEHNMTTWGDTLG